MTLSLIQNAPERREVGQLAGVVEELLGGARARVSCSDGKVRICRVPGRFRRSMRLRKGDRVAVQPWELSGDKRGDVVFNHTERARELNAASFGRGG